MQSMASDKAPQQELDRLANLATDVMARARRLGASQAAVAASVDTGISVGVRLGDVETAERTRDRGFGLTVYFGQRKGSASTGDLNPDSIQATLEQACAIAKYTEPDPCAGLAPAAAMPTVFPELDLWHPWSLDVEQAIALGQEVEAAGRAMAGITNSSGAAVETNTHLGVYANSHGFVGTRASTSHALSCALVAEDAGGKQRSYWYDSARARGDLAEPASIGRKAAKRTLARLGARRMSTRHAPVLFVPEIARGLVGHLLAAVSGGSLYRESSFLLNARGQRIFPAHVQMTENPWLKRGPASASFDADGVATRESSPLIVDGVLTRYLLGIYAARKLGMESTANAGGVRNLVVAAGEDDFAGLLKRMGTGLVVTEVMGQGVSIVTGDYSRGATGFWVENGAIVHPVEEITIAANLKDMFAHLVAVGRDVDRRGAVATGPILIEDMTIAGE